MTTLICYATGSCTNNLFHLSSLLFYLRKIDDERPHNFLILPLHSVDFLLGILI